MNKGGFKKIENEEIFINDGNHFNLNNRLNPVEDD